MEEMEDIKKSLKTITEHLDTIVKVFESIQAKLPKTKKEKPEEE